MNLSNLEQTQKDNFGPTKEYVRRLTITPLDTIWIARLEGSIEKRLVGYVDNHNTGVRRLDLIALPGEYIMITRRVVSGPIKHTTKQVFKTGLKDIFEANPEQDRVFNKVDLADSYVNDINLRFLTLVIGQENLVHYQPLHHPMSFMMTDVIGGGVFKRAVCYRTDGTSVELVRPYEWSDEWQENDNAVYAFVPFINVTTIPFLMQDSSKHHEWVEELVRQLETHGIYLNADYKGLSMTGGGKVKSERRNLNYPLPTQLFNVK